MIRAALAIAVWLAVLFGVRVICLSLGYDIHFSNKVGAWVGIAIAFLAARYAWRRTLRP